MLLDATVVSGVADDHGGRALDEAQRGEAQAAIARWNASPARTSSPGKTAMISILRVLGPLLFSAVGRFGFVVAFLFLLQNTRLSIPPVL